MICYATERTLNRVFIYSDPTMEIRIGVIGLGYVGLPLALAFGRRFSGTVGFDINRKKVEQLNKGIDPTAEGFDQAVRESSVRFTAEAGELKGCNFFVVGVPTPIDENKTPDLTPVISATKIVASVLKKGDIVVYESTVYPGVTEEICGPLLEEISGLTRGLDFKLGYSPERINPGDKERTLEKITKVVSGEDEETLEIVADVYASVVQAGVYKASSIKVAEAAKVIENTQRDLNIALMNELAIIFDRMNISTKDVLAAAGTKWNFLPFKPGLVGGHCIGVDPYYLTTKAQQLGYLPQVILAGRRINDDMGKFIAQRFVKLLITNGLQTKGARVGILGVTFKENVADLRNSRVPDVVQELKEFGIIPLVHDALADSKECAHEYGFELASFDQLSELDGVVFAVPHEEYLALGKEKLFGLVKKGGVFIDVKAVFDTASASSDVVYWSL